MVLLFLFFVQLCPSTSAYSTRPMMQKYIIFLNFVPIITNSCDYTGFMGDTSLFSRKS